MTYILKKKTYDYPVAVGTYGTLDELVQAAARIGALYPFKKPELTVEARDAEPCDLCAHKEARADDEFPCYICPARPESGEEPNAT